MAKKRDWHRLNRSDDPFDIELDLNNWVVRARKDQNTSWEYRKAYSFKHGLTTAEHIIYEQQKK